MEHLPQKALSIRQPWAWAIMNAGKRVENRDWPTTFRGPICIHASKGMTLGEFHNFVDFARMLNSRGWWTGPWIPEPEGLDRGCIVGVATIVDCVERSDSPWFFGRYGFVLDDVRPVVPIPVKGALGFFDWRNNLPASGQRTKAKGGAA